jgi:hypothetical protein
MIIGPPGRILFNKEGESENHFGIWSINGHDNVCPSSDCIAKEDGEAKRQLPQEK